LQENTAHPREILQMKINDTAEKSNRFNAKGIVHGRLRICNLLRLPRRGRSFEGPKCSIDSCPNLKPPAARRSAAGCLRSAVQACVLVQYKLSPSISPKPIPPKAPSKENSKERDGTMPSSPPSSSNAIVLRGRFVLAAISSRLRAA
jgi:hypothetical protein